MLQGLLFYISVGGGGNPVQREKREAGGIAPQHTMQAFEGADHMAIKGRIGPSSISTL